MVPRARSIESPLRERLSPSDAEPVDGAVVGAVLKTGPRIRIHGEDMAGIGTALHAVIAAELLNPDRDDALESAAALVAALADEGAVAPADAVGCARRLRAVLDARFNPRRLLVEHPVRMRHDTARYCADGSTSWPIPPPDGSSSTTRPLRARAPNGPTRRLGTRASLQPMSARFAQPGWNARGAGSTFP